MTVIGHFVPDTDGYVGSIRTLTLHAKLRLVAIDNKVKEDGLDFRILLGMQEVGGSIPPGSTSLFNDLMVGAEAAKVP